MAKKPRPPNVARALKACGVTPAELAHFLGHRETSTARNWFTERYQPHARHLGPIIHFLVEKSGRGYEEIVRLIWG